MFAAKYPGTCSICNQPFPVGAPIAANGSFQRADKVVRAFAHEACKNPPRPAFTAHDPGDIADAVAAMAVRMQDSPDDEQFGQAVSGIVGAAEVLMDPASRDAWGAYGADHEGWDGEPWPTLNGLITFLMQRAGRLQPKVGTAAFNRQWADWKVQYANLERQQEEEAFAAGLI